jgi:hypothetical protein
MWKWIAASVLTLSLCAPTASAKPHEARVPLHDGKLRTADLSKALCEEFHLPRISLSFGVVDLRGLHGSAFVDALNESLGEGFHVSLSDEALVMELDVDKLPTDCRSMKRATRVFTALVAPERTAKQAAYYGLWTPKEIDPNRRLVVLIHGLDCDRMNWQPMFDLLQRDHRQVALFTYPSDQPIEDSAKSLGEQLAALRLHIPNLEYDLICHSMGGLVARCYVESEMYRGGVTRLIMLGTPNRGTNWAS